MALSSEVLGLFQKFYLLVFSFQSGVFSLMFAF